MLSDGRGFQKVILICGTTDLRRGANGLSALVQLNFGLDPYEKGTLYLFCGRRSSLIKGFCFEGIGMGVYQGKPFPLAPEYGGSQVHLRGAVPAADGRACHRGIDP